MSPLVTPGIGLIFWTSVVFLILLIVLKKYAWTGIMTALKERAEFIQNSLDSADKAKEEMKACCKKQEARETKCLLKLK